MAHSSFFINSGTSPQLQGSASASAAAALASEQAALASKNASAVSETNAAASAASALVHSNTAASSVSSINASAISTAADVAAAAGHAATTAADAISTAADVVSTAADVVLAAASAANVQDWAIKVDGIVDSTGYSSKAWAIGGDGVTDTAGSGSAKSWAVEADLVDGTEHSAKSYAISGTAITAGSAKQWSLGGGTGFDRDTAVTGSGNTAEYSAKYWANQAKNETQTQRDVYYGAFTSDSAAQTYQTGAAPTGNAGTVDAGDLYFNSTSNDLRVFDGTNWNDVATDTTNLATKGFAIALAIAL